MTSVTDPPCRLGRDRCALTQRFAIKSSEGERVCYLSFQASGYELALCKQLSLQNLGQIGQVEDRFSDALAREEREIFHGVRVLASELREECFHEPEFNVCFFQKGLGQRDAGWRWSELRIIWGFVACRVRGPRV